MSDADGLRITRRRVTFFQLSQAAISWGSEQQQRVALSSCEAEQIMALSEAAGRQRGRLSYALFSKLGFDPDEPVSIHCDNTAARDLS